MSQSKPISRCQILEQTELLRFRVLSNDKVVYVLYDLDKNSMTFYTDPDLRFPKGLWVWEEKEIAEMIRKHLTVPTASVILDDPIFKRAPALQSLLKINDPKPDMLRACLMEMSRMVLGIHKRVEELESKKAVVNTNCVKEQLNCVTEQLKATLEVVDNLKEEYAAGC